MDVIRWKIVLHSRVCGAVSVLQAITTDRSSYSLKVVLEWLKHKHHYIFGSDFPNSLWVSDEVSLFLYNIVVFHVDFMIRGLSF